MSTVRKMLPAMGATVLVRFESLQILCTVLDVKNSWGKPRLLITPDSNKSSGQQWVEMDRVIIPAAEAVHNHVRNPYGECYQCGKKMAVEYEAAALPQ